MKKVIAIGEAMVELRPAQDNNYAGSVAGDVYNTAVYLKRLLGDGATVSFLTALGDDPVSAGLRDEFASQGIATDQVRTIPDGVPGLYMIHTDDTGERSFTYWRSASAARRMLDGETVGSLAETLASYDLAYLSGITLAILPETDALLLLAAAGQARKRGTAIAFDPNYRPKLWQDPETAKRLYEQAYGVCDILLPGFEDEQTLYRTAAPEDTITRLAAHAIGHVILKAGTEGIFITERRDHGQVLEHLPFTPAPAVVDTTAAGDSFAAGWLAGWLAGQTAMASARQGHAVASFVISQPGAITSKAAFTAFMEGTLQ